MQDISVDTIQGVSQAEFGKLAERHRHELQVHCYRMLGSFQDSEDLVQETFLRAWQKRGSFQGKGTFRAWLYKIATNACLDLLDKRPKRTLPTLYSRASDASAPPADPITEPIWLEPFPDELVTGSDSSPESLYSAREAITLAFLTALHALPPKQRAILILQDVLDWQAVQVAELLDLSVSAVNSALHRARVTLAKRYNSEPVRDLKQRISDEHAKILLDKYVNAWEQADLDGLIALLKEDACFTMPPSPSWYSGKVSIRRFIGNAILAGDSAGRYRLVASRANGQPAFGWYMRDEQTGSYRGFAIQIVTLHGGLISDVTTFMTPNLLTKIGLPAEIRN